MFRGLRGRMNRSKSLARAPEKTMTDSILYAIGVDGGGTKTLGRLVKISTEQAAEALLPDGPAPVVLATVGTGASNPHSNPEAVVRERLQQLMMDLCREGGIAPEKVNAVCMGMAGCDRPYERDLLTGIVKPVLPQARIRVTNDALTALVGGLGCLEGIMVISGTGSIALGARGAEKVVRAGGWGHFLDDAGSGFMLGKEALRRICRSHDHREPETALTDVILGHLELASPPDLIGWLNRINCDKATVASLSRFVLSLAEEGDTIAYDIAMEQARELVHAANTVRRILFPDVNEVQVVPGGGNLINNDWFREQFRNGLKSAHAALKLIMPKGEGLDGAVLLGVSELQTGAPFV